MNARRIPFVSAIVLAIAVSPAAAQEPPFRSPDRDSLRFKRLRPSEGIQFPAAVRPDYAVMAPLPTRGAAALPEVFLPRKSLPGRISLLNNNTLRLNRRIRLELSNGQAGNWSAYPDAFLDARTLSFPLPR